MIEAGGRRATSARGTFVAETVQTESALFFRTISFYILELLWTQPSQFHAQESNLSRHSGGPVVQDETG